MAGTFLFFLAAYGLTTILVQSFIMKPVRNYVIKKCVFLGKMLSCMMCTGFWVTIILSVIIGFSPSQEHLGLVNNFRLLMDAFSGVTVIVFMYLIQLSIEKKFNIEW